MCTGHIFGLILPTAESGNFPHPRQGPPRFSLRSWLRNFIDETVVLKGMVASEDTRLGICTWSTEQLSSSWTAGWLFKDPCDCPWNETTDHPKAEPHQRRWQRGQGGRMKDVYISIHRKYFRCAFAASVSTLKITVFHSSFHWKESRIWQETGSGILFLACAILLISSLFFNTMCCCILCFQLRKLQS